MKAINYYYKEICDIIHLGSHIGGGALAGGVNKGRPNWSKPNGGRSTKFGGGRLSGGGGANGLPKATRSMHRNKLTNVAIMLCNKISSKLIQTTTRSM